jgi:hypothetical protein
MNWVYYEQGFSSSAPGISWALFLRSQSTTADLKAIVTLARVRPPAVPPEAALGLRRLNFLNDFAQKGRAGQAFSKVSSQTAVKRLNAAVHAGGQHSPVHGPNKISHHKRIGATILREHARTP